MTMTSLLHLDHLTLAQGGRIVLDDICGDVPRGKITALIGANGAGKSTLIAGIMGVLKPISGQVRCDIPKERRAWLPQQLALDLRFPMSVEELIMTGCWPTHGALKGYSPDRYHQARDIMHRLDISHLAHRPLGELSGGQRQRALLGRTLMQNAELLILDEPFANVDSATVDVVSRVLRSMADQGVTVIVVLHDAFQMQQLADRVLLLCHGRAQWHDPQAMLRDTVSHDPVYLFREIRS